MSPDCHYGAAYWAVEQGCPDARCAPPRVSVFGMGAVASCTVDSGPVAVRYKLNRSEFSIARLAMFVRARSLWAQVAVGGVVFLVGLLARSGVAVAFGTSRWAPAHWAFTLSDGREVDVWADRVNGISDKTAKDPDIVFGVLMDIDIDQQDGFAVTARGTAPGRRASRWPLLGPASQCSRRPVRLWRRAAQLARSLG
ncbi:MAG TPA: hypothetical protein VME46_05685 [Acidimicrobiales bacterium]|nr:hypothetical protein [Acidimicrobiales bacterium]